MKKLIIYTALALTAFNSAAFAEPQGDCKIKNFGPEKPEEKICWTKPGGQYTLSGKGDTIKFDDCGEPKLKDEKRTTYLCKLVSKDSHEELMGFKPAPADVKIYRYFSHENAKNGLVATSQKPL